MGSFVTYVHQEVELDLYTVSPVLAIQLARMTRQDDTFRFTALVRPVPREVVEDRGLEEEGPLETGAVEEEPVEFVLTRMELLRDKGKWKIYKT